MKNASASPIYAQVAYDIAMKIVSGELKTGERFSGRSLMGSQYGVSPETIRRAMRLLSDMGIISVQQNVGYIVQSPERAVEYVERAGAGKDYHALRARLKELLSQRRELDREITEVVGRIVDLSDRFRRSDTLRTYEFTIEAGSAVIGQTIGAIRFRQKTGATVVAVRRGESISLSPGPESVLEQGDILLVACGLDRLNAVSELLYSCGPAPAGH